MPIENKANLKSKFTDPSGQQVDSSSDSNVNYVNNITTDVALIKMSEKTG